MSVPTFWGVILFTVALAALVAGDPTTIFTVHSAKVTTNPNDYFDPWSVEFAKGKRSSLISAKLPTKKDVPDNMQAKLYAKMEGQEPVEYTGTLCEGLEEELVGKTFGNAGIPKGKFPKECPFIAGDWGISQWDPPVHVIPPGVPDGRVTGYIQLGEEGKEPYIQIDYEVELSHELPMPFGR
ncbi:uncharacterized protein [Venturia canescens]|uniref:uncharacterized protein n=1 Tax=Venturia canescens TaxID=32260 RepID=UPI001C9C7228|nr:uncharacterized protein LOC122415776 [Venturia canescens]